MKTQINKAKEIDKQNISQIDDYEYNVQYKDTSFIVNMKIGVCSCNKGKFGQFCIHQCAVYIHFDTLSHNFPAVTSSDRHNIALLADGDQALPVEFFQSFILNSNTENISNEESVQINNIISNNTITTNENNNAPTTNTTNSQQIPQESEESIDNIINLFKEIHQHYGSSSSGLNTLETRLKKIKSKGNWETFLYTAENQAVQLRRRSGAAIRVQPTTIARPAVIRGSKRLPLGRPPKNEIKIKKRRINLGENIKHNQPNAKSHGSGH